MSPLSDVEPILHWVSALVFWIGGEKTNKKTKRLLNIRSQVQWTVGRKLGQAKYEFSSEIVVKQFSSKIYFVQSLHTYLVYITAKTFLSFKPGRNVGNNIYTLIELQWHVSKSKFPFQESM